MNRWPQLTLARRGRPIQTPGQPPRLPGRPL